MDHIEIDVSELDPTARSVLMAALTYARQNRQTNTHVLQLEEFFRLANLGDEVHIANFMGWVTEAMTATAFSPDYETEVLRGWPAFDSITVSRSGVEFAVNAMALDAEVFPL
jgi:hypothetical protein